MENSIVAVCPISSNKVSCCLPLCIKTLSKASSGADSLINTPFKNHQRCPAPPKEESFNAKGCLLLAGNRSLSHCLTTTIYTGEE